jgi:hypothetical protein
MDGYPVSAILAPRRRLGRRSMRLLLCFGLTVGLALFQGAHADPLLDGIGKVPGAVEDVRIGGTWEKEGKSGAYRVLISRSGGDTVTARLFVQWIAYHDDGEASVDTTIEIKELGALKVDVVDYTSESDQEGLSVYLETIDPNGNADQNYELHVTSPTEYKFGPASN